MKPAPKCKWKEGDLATYIRPDVHGGPVPVVIGAVRMATCGFGVNEESRLTVYFSHFAGEKQSNAGARDFIDCIDYLDHHQLLVKRKRAKKAA